MASTYLNAIKVSHHRSTSGAGKQCFACMKPFPRFNGLDDFNATQYIYSNHMNSSMHPEHCFPAPGLSMM